MDHTVYKKLLRKLLNVTEGLDFPHDPTTPEEQANLLIAIQDLDTTLSSLSECLRKRYGKAYGFRGLAKSDGEDGECLICSHPCKL